MSWMSMLPGQPQGHPRPTQAGDRDEGSPDSGGERSIKVAGDNPIQRSDDDTLGRTVVARSFAQQVLALDTRAGVVVGVLGPWGSGKTSFINLARSEFESASVPILDFNPWMFSGAHQLVDSFFIELAAQLKIHPDLADIGKDLEDYGEAFAGMGWLPVVGPWIERGRGLTKILSKILQRRKGRNGGIGARRAKLESALAKLDRPIVVVLDDIDRLSTAEIRDVFRLVRLTASFPNIIYVVAFDRHRVETALTEEGVPGRDYLEKILQVAVDLPAIPSAVLDRQIAAALDSALAGIDRPGLFQQDVWPDVFSEVIRPLIRNMRDVRRYNTAVRGTVGALEGQIALADVLALEAVRVFLPDVFGRLHGSIEGLTTPSELFSGAGGEPPYIKAQIDSLIDAGAAHGDVVRAMIERLFPAGQRHIGGSHYGADWPGRWLRERRVAHEAILRLYLERVVGEGLQAFTDAEQAWARMSNRSALDGYLRSLDPERLRNVIASLEVYEDEFVPEHVVPGAIVLLNLLPALPERQRRMFELDTRLVVSRVTYRLLRSLGNPIAVEAAVHEILPGLKSLSGKLELISDIGYREGRGHKLVSETAAAELERAWRDEVRAARAESLAEERDLLRVFLIARREADPSEPAIHVDEAPRVTLALLRSARSQAVSQTLGSRAIRRSSRLAWDVLIELCGDEETLKERIEQAKALRAEGVEDLFVLADRYLGGWRPTDSDDD